jgi:type IV pilus assembly protein PilY1
VPALAYDFLVEYANPDYGHRFYVDQTPYVAEDVEISGIEKTVLIGGMGKGGMGYYAIDISGVSGAQSFASKTESDLGDRILWEYPDTGTLWSEVSDLGYSLSRAYIYRSNDETNAPWIVVFGNGYNSLNSSAVLVILNAETGDLIHRIDTGATGCNGLSSPALFDSDFDGDVDYIYAGDLLGNLWKFDLTSDDYNEWGVAYGVDNAGFTAINADEGDDPAPVFQARGPGGSVQPITVEPDFMYHCDTKKPGMMVIFGTGKYLGADDITDTSVQTVYGIWDYGDDSQDNEYLGTFQRGFVPQLSNPELDNSVTLLEQTATDYTMDIEVDSDGDGTLDSTEEMVLRVLSDNTPDWQVTTSPDGSSCGDYPESENPCDPDCFPGCTDDPDLLAHAGWYVDLPIPGERVIGNPIIRLGVLNYISFIPEESPCGGEGNSFTNYADPCNGGNLGEEFIDINLDGIINEEDLINIGTEAEPIWVAPSARQFEGRLQPPAIVRMPGAYGESRDRYFFSSSLGTVVGQTTKSPKMGIIYWKDLLN